MALLTPNRRGFLTGLAALVAAPALVRAESLMPVKVIHPMLLAPESRTFFSPKPWSCVGGFIHTGDAYYRVMSIGDYGRAAYCLRGDIAARVIRDETALCV